MYGVSSNNFFVGNLLGKTNRNRLNERMPYKDRNNV